MRKLFCISILIVVILFWFAFAIHNALAAPGDFDPTFGTNGKVTTTMAPVGSEINKIVIQPDGKIIAAGWTQNTAASDKQFALARYHPNGVLDTTFGTLGRVYTTIPGGNGIAYDAVIQPNGRIVVVGMLFTGNMYSSVIVRYNGSGSLDTSFSNDGIHVYNYGAFGADHATNVLLQPDGKLLVASKSFNAIAGSANFPFFISRFTSTGVLDSTFNTLGKTYGDFGLYGTGHVNIGLQPDGKIIAAGPGGNGTNSDFGVMRFNTNGTVDTAFGIDAHIYTNLGGNDVSRTMSMLPDGRFIVGGYTGEPGETSLMLVRYMPNGSLDTTFGFAGFVTQDISPTNDTVDSIAVQPDGKTVVVGRTDNTTSNTDMVVVRYKANGLADLAIGTSGVKKISFGNGYDYGYSAAVQPNGRILAAGSGVQSGSPVFAMARLLGRGASGDYDNDGRSDFSVFRPSEGMWYLNRSDEGSIEYPFGTGTDRPLVADFDADGESDIAVFRPSNGRWYVLRSTAGYMTLHFGMQGDIPAAADFDGDDKADLAVFRPSTGIWYCLKSSSGFVSSFAQQFGMNGDKPVQGDYDRDGKADFAVYRPSDSVWYILGSARGFYSMRFGLPTDVPAPSDFDGDTAYDIAVYRPSDGVWHVLRSSDGNYQPTRFGSGGDIPQPADFDLDGRSDIAVYRPSEGGWYVLRSSDGAYQTSSWGLNGDRPMAAASE